MAAWGKGSKSEALLQEARQKRIAKVQAKLGHSEDTHLDLARTMERARRATSSGSRSLAGYTWQTASAHDETGSHDLVNQYHKAENDARIEAAAGNLTGAAALLQHANDKQHEYETTVLGSAPDPSHAASTAFRLARRASLLALHDVESSSALGTARAQVRAAETSPD